MPFKLQSHTELTQIQTRQDSSLGIMRWGESNSFPQTLVNLVAQSPSAAPAVNRTATFLKGAGFEGEDMIVSPLGLTLGRVVDIVADDYAMFSAFGLQCNYNMHGLVSGLNPMRIPTLRFNEFDELNFASKIGYHANFARNSVEKKTVDKIAIGSTIKWFNRFNPEEVEAQIEKAGGVADYLGQLLYHSDAGHSSYPISKLQAPINYVLSDVENSILVRKETATGFISSYILKTTMDSEDARLTTFQDALVASQGARGTGKVTTFAGLSPEEVDNLLLEEIGTGSAGRSTAIVAAKTAFELARDVINGAYLIPPALAGIEQSQGFSGADLKEAYFVFNAVTQPGRNIIETEINRVLKHSKFKVKSIKIEPLSLDVEEIDAIEDLRNKKKDK